jgi:hypothetical protein
MKDYIKHYKFNDFLFEIRYIGKTINELWNEKTERDTFLIVIKVSLNRIQFTFYDSIHNTELRSEKYRTSQYHFNKGVKEANESLLSSVISCINSDYFCEVNNYYDFCDSYGYTPSRQSEKIYNLCKEQYEKLHSIFKDEDIEKMNVDENENILKQFEVIEK